jgi:hypothetical protein
MLSEPQSPNQQPPKKLTIQDLITKYSSKMTKTEIIKKLKHIKSKEKLYEQDFLGPSKFVQ